MRPWDQARIRARIVAVRGRTLSSLLTHRVGLLPDYAIIGTQRGGTTSLFRYLERHPLHVSPSVRKETHFFDRNFDKGENWYRSHFPTQRGRRTIERRLGSPVVLGEATPGYLAHPAAPRRMAAVAPDAKLVLLLRNPVDRAYSQYCWDAKRGRTTLSFRDAVRRELASNGRQAGAASTDLSAKDAVAPGYVSRGHYAVQLQRWLLFFDRDQMLIIASEDFFAQPQRTLLRVQVFLGLPARSLAAYDQQNATEAPPIDPETRGDLADHYAEHNRRLCDLLGRDMGWNGR